MAHIKIENLSLSYPVIRVGSTIREAAVYGMTGGLIKRGPGISTVEAIRNLTMDIQSGDRIGLLGHNGAGKSTLLRTMAGIYQASSGTLDIDGRIGSMLDIGFGIDPEETGWENLRFVFNLIAEDRSKIPELIQEIADFTELGEFLYMPVRTYSAGMQMRLSFGIATASSPNILLMDEVIGAGDAGFYVKAEQRLQRIADTAEIIVLATHSLDLITSWCTKVAWLEKGEMLEFGPTEEIMKKYIAAVS
jgi:ABC-type polysaccharide/polyol phosphate transport system ATPase subunit